MQALGGSSYLQFTEDNQSPGRDRTKISGRTGAHSEMDAVVGSGAVQGQEQEVGWLIEYFNLLWSLSQK